MFNFFKKNLLLVLFIIGVILILAELIIINNGSHNPTFNKYDLKGYDTFRQNLNKVASDKTVTNSGDYGRLLGQLNSAENKKLTDKDRYLAIAQAQSYMRFLYTNSHNANFRDLNSDLEYVAKTNFKSYYQKTDFTMYCQDPTCQDTPQPQEILRVIDEIKASSIADYSKQSNIDNLLNVGYMSKNNIDAKVYSYIVMSKFIKISGPFAKAGLNDKIANEISEYLIKNYPQVVNKVLGSKTIEESRLRLEGK